MKRATSFLPDSLPPIGINREQAAAFVGIGSSLFDKLVMDGRMPSPRIVEGRNVWDVEEVAIAFRALPHRAEVVSVDETGRSRNPWD